MHLIKKLKLAFITICLKHKVSKKKDKEPQGYDMAMSSHQCWALNNNEGAPTTWGVTFVLSWAKLLVIVKANVR